MEVDFYLIASICVLSVLFVLRLIAKIVHDKKNGKEIDILEYLTSFSDKITVIAEQVILVCNMDSQEFESEEEFKKELLEKVILTLKESATELGIDISIINLIDANILADYVYKIIESNEDYLASMVSIKNSDTPVIGDTTTNTVGSTEIYTSQITDSDTSETTNK